MLQSKGKLAANPANAGDRSIFYPPPTGSWREYLIVGLEAYTYVP
jgi:hypothetical protein